MPAAFLLGLAGFFWPARELRSDNFVFYFPSGHQVLPFDNVSGVKYFPLMPTLNLIGKVGGIQEKKSSLKVWFESTQIELRKDDTNVQVGKASYQLPQRVHLTNGQWTVPLDFLTDIVPHLTHQAVEYQAGTNRIFIGDVKLASYTARLDPIANGVRLTVQFTDKVAVQTASSNGRWVVFLGNQPMEPTDPSYHFQNPYVTDLQYDDQDGVPKLILSPTSGGLNFYPLQAEGGKILLADIVKPPSAGAQALPPPAGQAPSGTQPNPAGPAPQVTAEAPAAPPGAPLPVVALDAAHGGDDNGGHSQDGVLEKNLTAQFVARIRSALLATEKYRVVLCRTGDASVTSEERALAANVSGAICFITFHAGDLGTASPRVALFTFVPPSPPPAGATSAPFVPWDQAQEARLSQSQQLAVALQQQLSLINGAEVDAPAGAPVRTLRNVSVPAVAIEVGRLAPGADAAALTNPALQQQVAGAIVQAVTSFAKGGN